jgi:hypothetical protein
MNKFKISKLVPFEDPLRKTPKASQNNTDRNGIKLNLLHKAFKSVVE